MRPTRLVLPLCLAAAMSAAQPVAGDMSVGGAIVQYADGVAVGVLAAALAGYAGATVAGDVLGAGSGTRNDALVLSAWLAYPLGTAVGVATTGRLLRKPGRFGPAAGSALLAAGLSAGLYTVGHVFRESAAGDSLKDLTGRNIQTSAVAVAVLGVPLASVLSSHASARRELRGRFLSPELGLAPVLGPGGRTGIALRARVFGLRI